MTLAQAGLAGAHRFTGRRLVRVALQALLAAAVALGAAACNNGSTNTSHTGPQHAKETKPTYKQD